MTPAREVVHSGGTFIYGPTQLEWGCDIRKATFSHDHKGMMRAITLPPVNMQPDVLGGFSLDHFPFKGTPERQVVCELVAGHSTECSPKSPFDAKRAGWNWSSSRPATVQGSVALGQFFLNMG